jgi:Putative auto-transporter adhesin, head GIN domain
MFKHLLQSLWFIVGVVLISIHAEAQTLPPFTATTLDFSGFVGKIYIEASAEKSISLQLRRGEASLLKTKLHQGVLYISYALHEQTSDAIHYQGNIMQIRSVLSINPEFIIGNKKYTGTGTREAAELIVRAPTGVALQSYGFKGDATIDAMNGPANLGVSEGHISAKRLGPARLRVKGTGSITLDEATGELRGLVEGAGNIDVKGGSVERAWADAKGTGNIRYTGGRIHQAYVSARGTSTITLDGVVKVTKGAIEGASEIEINSVLCSK